jgi:hypothetical protein
VGPIRGTERSEEGLLPEPLEEYIPEEHPVRFIEALVEELDEALGFPRAKPAATGARPPPPLI